MDQAIQDFQNLLVAQGRSKRTVTEYVWQMHKLAAWGAKEHPPLLVPKDFKQRDLARYLSDRRLHDEAGNSSIGLAISTFRSFFDKFVGARSNPAKKLDYPRAELHEQRVLSPEQAKLVLSMPDTSSVIGRRDLAILCLLLDTGLRASEVCTLSIGELHLEENYLTVMGKRRKLLFKAICNYTAMQIANWLAVRSAEPDCDRLFVSVLRGRGTLAPPGKPLTREALRGVCQRVAGPAGIAELSPHDFRRSCTCFMVGLGCPDRLTELQLGWSENPQDMLARYSLTLRVKQCMPYLPVAWLTGTGAWPDEAKA